MFESDASTMREELDRQAHASSHSGKAHLSRRLEQSEEEVDGHPLMIFCADADDDAPQDEHALKLIIARFMLGAVQIHMLSHKSTPWPTAKVESVVANICERIAKFDGEIIDFYILGPGRGHLGAVMQKLQSDGAWPPRATLSVSLYSGSYNMRGMQDSDLAAIQELVREAGQPLVDVGKYPFFGGDHCHPWTASLTTFATDTFAVDLNMVSPLLAAALRLFNDSHNAALISPDSNIWKETPLTEDERSRFDDIARLFGSGSAESLRAYAKAILLDDQLFAKVANHKKSTLTAFAHGGCDAPLCAQLVFLNEWLVRHMPEALAKRQVGNWKLRYMKNSRTKKFTMIDLEGTSSDSPVRGVQPVLKDPCDEDVLMSMREAIEDYLFRHLKKVHSQEQA
eukprot:TRINITY_DN23149_c0_g1_i1.p1 TRINITY_DN23149_c0_g1~~TRINITY_DN23149_c0_g1_i1.p1  ORF type:complete len:397 (+),score=95.30 TRINITY_DN23149_c0_g1_i1:144-1334(+)